MGAPAALGSAIAYRHMLSASGMPLMLAHVTFEEELDALAVVAFDENTDGAAVGELDVATKRAILAAGIHARGEDITSRQHAGAAP